MISNVDLALLICVLYANQVFALGMTGFNGGSRDHKLATIENVLRL